MSDNAQAMLENEVHRLRGAVAATDDPRLTALLVAASDSGVAEILAERLAEAYPYSGALVTTRDDRIHIVFVFSREQGQFGLIPLSVLVVVDIAERRVTRVVGNYLAGGNQATSRPGALQPGLDL